jgi:type IV secretion system protein TrbE
MLNLREFRKNPDKLSDILPWAALIAPGVVLNKDGSFQRTISYRGPDLDSATEPELVATAARINNALKRLGSGWAVFTEAQRIFSDQYPEATFDNPIAYLIDEERRIHFKTLEHFESLYYLTLVFLPPSDTSGKLAALFVENSGNEAID